MIIIFYFKDNSGAGDTKKPKFVATKEWQDIQEGQSVPSGLHYRMNLETGRKEAKLMDVDVETGFILLLIRASSCIYFVPNN